MEETLDFHRLCIFGSGRSIARLARPYIRDREVLIVEDSATPSRGATRA